MGHPCIGGLLAVEVVGATSLNHVYLYDGNGNVGQTLNIGNDSLSARYEYDPYGNLVSILGGPFRNGNPFRFSTKYFDKELDLHGTDDGLYYYGYRFYSPRLGRWVNRDPAGEMGDFLLSRFVGNAPSNETDVLGLMWNGDMHLDRVKDLAYLAGFSCWEDIGRWSEAADTDSDKAPIENGKAAAADLIEAWFVDLYDPIRARALRERAERTLERVRKWHFPADEDGVVRPNSEVARAMSEEGLATCDLEKFSRGLHILMDSWSHQGKPYWRGIMHWRGWDFEVGPDYEPQGVDVSGTLTAALSGSTDNVILYPASARAALGEAYKMMRRFMNDDRPECRCACPDGEATKGGPIRTTAEVERRLRERFPGDDVMYTPYDDRPR